MHIAGWYALVMYVCSQFVVTILVHDSTCITELPAGQKIFGHLHLVLRDFHGDTDEVKAMVFDGVGDLASHCTQDQVCSVVQYNSCVFQFVLWCDLGIVNGLLTDGMHDVGRYSYQCVRNETREVIRQSFESVTVWGLPPPTRDAMELSRGDFSHHPDDICDEYLERVGALRQCLVAQLSEPKLFPHALTAGMIAAVVAELARYVLVGLDHARIACIHVPMMKLRT